MCPYSSKIVDPFSRLQGRMMIITRDKLLSPGMRRMLGSRRYEASGINFGNYFRSNSPPTYPANDAALESSASPEVGGQFTFL